MQFNILLLSLFILFTLSLSINIGHSHSSSFLQSKIETETNLTTFELSNSNLLSEISLKSKKKRKMQDGRDCAAAFVQEGRTYTDCTLTKSPDGNMNGKEWCYAETATSNYEKWGYCIPILDYDRVRHKSFDFIYELIPEIKKINDIVKRQAGPCANVIDTVENIKVKQGKYDEGSSNLLKKIEDIERKHLLLLGIKNKCESIEKTNELIIKEIDNLKKIAEKDNSKNCEGLLGYDQEKEGNGVLAEYFDNENFLGTSIKNTEKNINFDWTGETPIENINEENFSTRFEGYLYVPISGYYQFIIEVDDGCAFYLNDQLLINKKMEKSNGKKEILETSNVSDEIFLVGGLKYQIIFLHYHSIHNNYIEDGSAFAKISWKSNEFPLEIIPEENFYLTNKIPPLKIYNYKFDKFSLATLREFDDAFKDSSYFKMADIPLKYRGLSQLRTNLHFIDDSIELKSNSPVTIYIAINNLIPNYLPKDFQNTEDLLSILKISKHSKTQTKEVKAVKSIPFKIYKKDFPQGPIRIHFDDINSKSIKASLLIFFQLNLSIEKRFSCGGKESNIGLINGPAFESCSASSTYPNNQWNCEHAFSGKLIDSNYAMWATNGEGIGAWIQIFFKKEYQVTAIEYKNRDNPGERTKEIEVRFSNGETEVTKLKNSEIPSYLKITPTITKSIKFRILSVYGTINNGGAFNIIGLPCKNDIQEINKIGMIDDENIISLRCDHNLINNEQISKMNFQIGSKFKASCSGSCNDQNVAIYGSLIYSEDSVICKSAYHMGVISASGGNFIIMIQKGMKNYKSEVRNGISSEIKEQSLRSITFEILPEEKIKLISKIFLGMKVDIFDSLLKAWLPGIVIQVDQISKSDCKILVMKEGYPPEFNENIEWPNPIKVDFCGSRLTNRFCDPQSRHNKKTIDFDIKLCFTPKTECPSGYVVDNGDKYGSKGSYIYGWSIDMKNNGRTRYSHSDTLLDNLILFSPDKNSKWCLNNHPEILCEPVNWSISVPNGKYSIKITMGDALNKAGYWLKINGKILVDGKILDKNQFYSPSTEVTVTEKSIKITADCDHDCYFIWSRINIIEIKYKSNVKEENNKNEETTNLGCGNSFKGGRCNDGSDPLNCIYENSMETGLEKCSGSMMVVQISNKYDCIDQREKLKCIKKKFFSSDECKRDCPGNCKGSECFLN